MYVKVFTKAVATFPTEVVSQAVVMTGANAARVELTVNAITASSVTLYLEGSNDLENWEAITNSGALATVIYRSFVGTPISFQYVRVRAAMAAAGTSIVEAGINTAQL